MTVEQSERFPSAAPDLVREVLIHGPVERSELAARLRLSPASLTRLSKPYFDAGLLVEGVGQPRPSAGRRPRPVDVRLDARTFIGIKLTGEDATAVRTDLRANVLATECVPLAGRALDGVVRQVADVVARLGAGATIDAVGVSIGGHVEDRRLVRVAGFLGWRDVPLADTLESAIGMPVYVENDVVALLAAEHWFGPARHRSSFALVTIGAGVGYGLVLNGQIVTSSDTELAPLGHAPLVPGGPLCGLGHRGCASAMVTIPGMCSQVSAVRGAPITFEELLTEAATGDIVCRSVVDGAARALGRLVAWIANTTTVTTVVISGEGNVLFTAAEDAVRAACAADRREGARPVEFILERPDFVMWARGAAAVAIQDSVLGAELR